eukprot:7029344-Alexandrium_andersonii.AAC.1
MNWRKRRPRARGRCSRSSDEPLGVPEVRSPGARKRSNAPQGVLSHRSPRRRLAHWRSCKR